MASPSAPLTVLFDMDCGFCVWTVRQLRLLDRSHSLRFISLQSAERGKAGAVFAAVAASYPLRRALHVRRPDGSVRSRGRALLWILAELPGGSLVRLWSRLPGVVWLSNHFYDWVAAHRDRLGRLVARDAEIACAVDEAPVRPASRAA